MNTGNKTTTKVRNTGLGAASVAFKGKQIIFDENGNYPMDSKEYFILQNAELRARNQFLEDIIYRASMQQVSLLEGDYEYININDYVYC